MSITKQTALDCLRPRPLDAVILSCVRATWIWVARHKMRVDLPDECSLTCKVFEAEMSHSGDRIYVDGHQRVCLLRSGKHWEARFLAVAQSPGGAYPHLAPEDRAYMERVRDVQCCVNQGLLKLMPMRMSEAAATLADTCAGAVSIVPKDLALQARRDGDIVLSHHAGTLEWRSTTPMASLRSVNLETTPELG